VNSGSVGGVEELLSLKGLLIKRSSVFFTHSCTIVRVAHAQHKCLNTVRNACGIGSFCRPYFDFWQTVQKVPSKMLSPVHVQVVETNSVQLQG